MLLFEDVRSYVDVNPMSEWVCDMDDKLVVRIVVFVRSVTAMVRGIANALLVQT